MKAKRGRSEAELVRRGTRLPSLDARKQWALGGAFPRRFSVQPHSLNGFSHREAVFRGCSTGGRVKRLSGRG